MYYNRLQFLELSVRGILEFACPSMENNRLDTIYDYLLDPS
jgi:hypothetical protein